MKWYAVVLEEIASHTNASFSLNGKIRRVFTESFPLFLYLDLQFAIQQLKTSLIRGSIFFTSSL